MFSFCVLARVCLCVLATHRQQALLVPLGAVQGALQGEPVLLGQVVQHAGLALLHMARLLLVARPHVVHLLLVRRLLLAQALGTHVGTGHYSAAALGERGRVQRVGGA